MASWHDVASKPSDDSIVFRINPRGIRGPRYTFSERLQKFSDSLSQLRYIVGAEAKTRVFDKALGQLWLLLEPIILAGLYFFITTVVFSFGGEQRQFLFILSAVIFWRWFSRTVDGSPMAIVGYASVLKQTRFSPTMVIFAYIATESFFFLISLIVLFSFLAFYHCYPNINYVYLPLVALAQLSIMSFLTVIFATAGTFFKDLGGALYAITSVWWYLSPGIYPVSRIPSEYLWIYKLNPFAHILPAYRDILIDGVAPELFPILIIIAVFSFLAYFALRMFEALKFKFFLYL